MKHNNEYETDPAFGWIYVNRSSVSPPGAALFDSSIRHQEVVTLRISTASRNRSLHNDYIHENLQDEIVEVHMSFAQWAQVVSSFGSSGTPCTINSRGRKLVPFPEHEESRLAVTAREIETSAEDAIQEVRDAYNEVRAARSAGAGTKKMNDLLHNLECMIDNLPKNLKFSADQLTEHAENVVTKAKADIEATAIRAAQAAGIELSTIAPLGIGPGTAPKKKILKGKEPS